MMKEVSLCTVESVGVDFIRVHIPSKTLFMPSRTREIMKLSKSLIGSNDKRKAKPGAKFLLTYQIVYDQDGNGVSSMSLDFNKQTVKDFKGQWQKVQVVSNGVEVK